MWRYVFVLMLPYERTGQMEEERGEEGKGRKEEKLWTIGIVRGKKDF